jgi:hypothetical protein
MTEIAFSREAYQLAQPMPIMMMQTDIVVVKSINANRSASQNITPSGHASMTLIPSSPLSARRNARIAPGVRQRSESQSSGFPGCPPALPAALDCRAARRRGVATVKR